MGERDLEILPVAPGEALPRPRRPLSLCLGLAAVAIFAGGFVAGLVSARVTGRVPLSEKLCVVAGFNGAAQAANTAVLDGSLSLRVPIVYRFTTALPADGGGQVVLLMGNHADAQLEANALQRSQLPRRGAVTVTSASQCITLDRQRASRSAVSP